ncbi:hypothetical protein [Vibrio phage H188]|nr:hypothetical protein [Vibrio phage H188]
MFSVLNEGRFSEIIYHSLSIEILEKHEGMEVALIPCKDMIGDIANTEDINKGVAAIRRFLYSTISDPIKNEWDYEKEGLGVDAESLKIKWLNSVVDIKNKHPFVV